MSRCPFNERQLEMLEQEFQMFRRIGVERPPRKHSATMCFILERHGPFVDSQTVGRWFGQRAKREDGLPRQQSKTPAQLAMLEESFAEDPYPDSIERMRLVRGTLLSKSQVDAWFSVQRKRRTDEVEAHGYVIAHGASITDMRVPPEVSGELRRAWKEVEKERQEALRKLAEEENDEEQASSYA